MSLTLYPSGSINKAWVFFIAIHYKILVILGGISSNREFKMAEKRIVTAARNGDLEQLKHWIEKGQHLLEDEEGISYGILASEEALRNHNFEIARYIIGNIPVNLDYSNRICKFVVGGDSFSRLTSNYINYEIYDFIKYVHDLGYPINRDLIQEYINEDQFNELLLYYFSGNNSLNDFEISIQFIKVGVEYAKRKPYLDFQKIIDILATSPKFGSDFNYGLNSIVMHIFSASNYLAKIEYLLNIGADPNTECSGYRKPVFEHSSGYVPLRADVLKLLAQYGANLFEPDENKNNVPLLFSLLSENILDYDNLLSLRYSVKDWNITDEWGRNILHYYLTNGPVDQTLIDLLLGYGVDPDQRAAIADQQKVISAKMKGTLPWGYGKTFREIINQIEEY